MQIKVKAPTDKSLRINDDFMIPLFTLIGDMLVAGKKPKFQVALSHNWFKKLEGEVYEFITGDTKYTLRERLLVCQFIAGFRYDRKIPETEIQLEEVK